MSNDGATRVIRELCRDLEPVTPIPPLGRVAAGVGLLWLVVAVLAIVVRGVRPDLLDTLHPGGAFLAIVSGLALMGAGGVAAALASAVPGCERIVRAGLGVGVIGVLASTCVGTLLVIRGAGSAPPSCLFSHDIACFSVSCLLALPPALGALGFISRATPFRPLLTVLTVTTAAVALGAFLVHLTCPQMNPRHIVLSHVLAPFGGALLLTFPFHLALRRIRTR